MSVLHSLTACLLLLLAPLAATASEPRRLPAPEVTPEVTVASYTDTADYEPFDLPAAPRFELGAKFNKGIFIRGTDPKKDPFSI